MSLRQFVVRSRRCEQSVDACAQGCSRPQPTWLCQLASNHVEVPSASSQVPRGRGHSAYACCLPLCAGWNQPGSPTVQGSSTVCRRIDSALLRIRSTTLVQPVVTSRVAIDGGAMGSLLHSCYADRGPTLCRPSLRLCWNTYSSIMAVVMRAWAGGVTVACVLQLLSVL